MGGGFGGFGGFGGMGGGGGMTPNAPRPNSEFDDRRKQNFA